MITWIKLLDTLHEDPRVFRMGEILTKTAQTYILATTAKDLFGPVTDTITHQALRDITVAGLARVWRGANHHTTDGVFKHANLSYLDTLAQIPGFGKAMAEVGWAVYDAASNTTSLPNFDEHNAPAKNGERSKTSHAQRQVAYRLRLKQREAETSRETPAETPTKMESDVTPSYSSSNSESDSEIRKMAGRINSLCEGWSTAPDWRGEDAQQLIEAMPDLQRLSDTDWKVLDWFVRFVGSAANASAKDPVRLTTKRGTFVKDIASVLQRAHQQWKREGRPGAVRKPKPKPSPAPEPPVNEDPSANGAAFANLISSMGIVRHPTPAPPTNPCPTPP